MSRAFRMNHETAVVSTDAGTLQGYFDNDLYIFKGIPYAKAKRFHDPQPVTPWTGVRNCTSYSYVCPLLSMSEPAGELLVPHRYWVMNENCLNLNVWTQGLDDHKRPVVVWLHGGGYEAGSAIEQVAYEGENMARLGDVVVVSINHRLNILGYLDLSDFGDQYANSGNAGTTDMIAALKWIHDNIASFGGDPDNVTLFGQSGGGGKVTALLQTPAADGLFHKGLIMSGVLDSNLLPECEGSGKEAVLAIMKELGISSVSELETVPYDRMAQAYNKVRPDLNKRGLNNGGSPHPNEFYAGEPLKNGFRKETSEIPLIVGSVFGEFTGFAPTAYDKNILSLDEQKALLEKTLGPAAGQLIPLFEKAYPERKLIDLIQLDTIFRKPSIEYVRKRAKLNDKTWTYLFNMDSDLNDGTVPWHCSDIPYVFHNCEYVPTQDSDPDRILEEKIFDAFMNFVKTGNPNTDKLPEWPASTPDQEYTMVLDQGPRVKVNFDHQLEEAGGDILAAAAFSALSQNPDSVQH